LDERGIEYEYVEVDINDEVLKVHKLLNPKSQVVQRDAYSFTDDELGEFDFIWASPPCQSHSRANHIWKCYNPDMRLYDLIRQLHRVGKPFVVENVIPYYEPPIPPSYRVDRHFLWTNIRAPLFIEKLPRKPLDRMGIRELARFHDVPLKCLKLLKNTDKRQVLRNMVNWRLSYRLARWIFSYIEGVMGDEGQEGRVGFL
jgi:DNA (cytosine-5)-methyltransferase 1